MTLNDAVKHMRGKPNTDITLTIIRKGDPKPKSRHADTRRDPDPEREEQSHRAGYAYVRVTQFQEHTAEKLSLRSTRCGSRTTAR